MLLCIIMSILKKQLYQLCYDYIVNRILTAENAIQGAAESAGDDTKSSAGDKYETGREMMQQEIDRNVKLLEEARRQKAVLEQLNPDLHSDWVINGSLVSTNHGNFYIAISAGQLEVDGRTYFAVSAISPIGSMLLGKKKSDSFEFNHKVFEIRSVE